MTREKIKKQSNPFSSIFSNSNYQTKKVQLPSSNLKRLVHLEIIFPKESPKGYEVYKFLFLNDGQDLRFLHFDKILEELFEENVLKNLITIAIHAGERIQEYGVAGIPDYLGRGKQAANYQLFLVDELFPFIRQFFNSEIKSSHTAIIGFSLGGLSAFDFAWNYPQLVSKVGIFSGSFWWRSKAFGPDYLDSDRIIHTKINLSDKKPSLKFWFQTGTEDEKNDRNQNGIIDSIEDTLDLTQVLVKKGYSWTEDISYLEIEGGEHNPKTWSQVMPDFLKWAFLYCN